MSQKYPIKASCKRCGHTFGVFKSQNHFARFWSKATRCYGCGRMIRADRLLIEPAQGGNRWNS